MLNYMIFVDNEIEELWDAVQKAQIVIHPIFAPEGRFNIGEFRKRIDEKPFLMVIDRNIFSALIRLCRQGELEDKHEMQMIGILMAWADLNRVSVTVGPALMEYATNGKTQDDALRELKMFQEIMEQVPSQIWLEVARGIEKITPCNFSGGLADKITVDYAGGCEHYYLSYASMVHLAILYRSRSTRCEKMEKFLEWSYDNVIISNYVIVYSILLFSNQSHVSAPKNVMSKSIDKILAGCRNQAWDLSYISNLGYLYFHEKDYKEDFLFATNDNMLKMVYINGIDIEGIGNLIYSAFNKKEADRICLYINERQKCRVKPIHEDEIQYYKQLVENETKVLERIINEDKC